MVQKDASTVTKTRGRPRAFNPVKALHAMREVFWHKGYAATSLDDLCAAAGMNRPSLYNAFKEKAEVFKAVLDDYVAEVKPLYEKAFLAPVRYKEALLLVYETAFNIYLVHTKGLGCFMIGAALTDSTRDTDVAAMILEQLRKMDRGFLKLAQAAERRGELKPGVTPEQAAILCASIHNAISVRMRAGETVDDLRCYVKQAVNIICA
ncbi:bacterial regulatory protein, tetR family protein [Asticcacaulis biprosthecium C19]|uniref:Bacterial regulatory protein, tetR family protein n=1 Tax=Asticcacaulis biprosthecium C19 TaxID=715226 RepID=F4QM78_9CAUL|nr:bacterial regulatory protein, tetR family protein [Asticcacaulis biprosthecium C19]